MAFLSANKTFQGGWKQRAWGAFKSTCWGFEMFAEIILTLRLLPALNAGL